MSKELEVKTRTGETNEYTAIRVSIEALERHQNRAKLSFREIMQLLPGETEEQILGEGNEPRGTGK